MAWSQAGVAHGEPLYSMAPFGPLYSRKRFPSPQALFRFHREAWWTIPLVVAPFSNTGSDPFSRFARIWWERLPAAIKQNATLEPKRAWCMGCPFAGIKRTQSAGILIIVALVGAD